MGVGVGINVGEWGKVLGKCGWGQSEGWRLTCVGLDCE